MDFYRVMGPLIGFYYLGAAFGGIPGAVIGCVFSLCLSWYGRDK